MCLVAVWWLYRWVVVSDSSKDVDPDKLVFHAQMSLFDLTTFPSLLSFVWLVVSDSFWNLDFGKVSFYGKMTLVDLTVE